MPERIIIKFDDLLLESDVQELIAQMDGIMQHIHDTIPNEILHTPSGEPNVRTRWGAVYFHASMARASLKAFL